MGGEYGEGIVQPACIRKSGNASQEPEGGKEGKKRILRACRQKGQKQHKIHRYTAELKGKVPPVVTASIYHKDEQKLFYNFTESKKDSDEKENAESFFYCQMSCKTS